MMVQLDTQNHNNNTINQSRIKSGRSNKQTLVDSQNTQSNKTLNY